MHKRATQVPWILSALGSNTLHGCVLHAAQKEKKLSHQAYVTRPAFGGFEPVLAPNNNDLPIYLWEVNITFDELFVDVAVDYMSLGGNFAVCSFLGTWLWYSMSRRQDNGKTMARQWQDNDMVTMQPSNTDQLINDALVLLPWMHGYEEVTTAPGAAACVIIRVLVRLMNGWQMEGSMIDWIEEQLGKNDNDQVVQQVDCIDRWSGTYSQTKN